LFEDYDYLLEAISSGELSLERLDEAVTRILALKASLHIHDRERFTSENYREVVGCKAHKELAELCADEAVTLVKDTQKLLPVTPEKYKRALVIIIDEPGFTDTSTCKDTVLAAVKDAGFDVTYYNTADLTLLDTQIPEREFKATYDVIMYFVNVVNASYKTTARIRWSSLAAIDAPYHVKDVPTLMVSLANPYHFVDAPMIRTLINSYSPSKEVVRATMDKIMGKSEFKGKSPVDPFCGFWGSEI
jgi:beta-N-acetylhexosaminidase